MKLQILHFHCRKLCTLTAEFVLLELPKSVYFALPFTIYQFLRAPEGFKGEFSLLQTIALVGMAVLVVVAAIQFYRNQYSLLPKSTQID